PTRAPTPLPSSSTPSATPDLYTLSLHDALPISWRELAAQGLFLATTPSSSFFYVLTAVHGVHLLGGITGQAYVLHRMSRSTGSRSEEHTSELQSLAYLVCRLLLEKKKINI